MQEVRCTYCNKLLGKFTIADGEIKCPRCGTMNAVKESAK
jgi:phage FluMu protein Com